MFSHRGPFPFLNMEFILYQAFSSFDCLYNISSFLFQVMVGPCKLACLVSLKQSTFETRLKVFISFQKLFFDPQPQSEGSYKIGSILLFFCLSFRLSFRLSISFLRIGSLVFSKTWHGVTGPYIVVCDRARFF